MVAPPFFALMYVSLYGILTLASLLNVENMGFMGLAHMSLISFPQTCCLTSTHQPTHLIYHSELESNHSRVMYMQALFFMYPSLYHLLPFPFALGDVLVYW